MMNTGNSKTKVAIIGLGNIGKAIATNLTKGDYDVIVASRSLSKAKEFANLLGNTAIAQEIKTAIKNADIVIPALYFEKIKVFLQTYANELTGKIVVDVSNPIAPDENGGFKKIIEQDQSAGKILSELTPANTLLVKAFGTLGVDSLLNAAFSEPERNVLFYASDNTNSNSIIEEVITKSGFAPLHIGGIDQSIRIEVFGDLHEFGALGKPLTMEEAKKVVGLHSI